MRKVSLWITAALITALLNGCSSFQADSLNDAALVWKEKEVFTYDFSIDGKSRGENVMSVEKEQTDDRTLYHIDLSLEIDGGQVKTGAIVDGTSFSPVSAYNLRKPPEGSQSKAFEAQGSYQGQELHLTISQEDKEQKLKLKLPENVIDNESSLMLARNFPLGEGYRKKLAIAVIGSAQIAPYELFVEKTESVEVPYGKYNCYKVIWRYKGAGSVPDMVAWYTADENKLLLKYTNRNTMLELREAQLK